MKRNFWDKLAEFPPIACRLLARTKTPKGGVRALTCEEIAKAAGMTVMEINSISWLTSWESVPLGKIRKFTEGCGIILSKKESLRSHTNYIKRGASFKYLKKSKDWEHVYKPMIIAYVSTRV